jgi:large repetitive protein
MRGLRPSRRTVVRLVLRSVAVAAAVTLTAPLAEHPSKSAFTAATGDSGNDVTASPSFCTTTGTTLNPVGDTSGYQANPTTTYATYGDLGAISENGANARALLRFTLPSLPTGCTLTGATLRLYANRVAAGRTIQVHRVDPATSWTEAGTTWNTLPSVVAGTAVEIPSRSTVGWMQWMVTGIVTSHYAGTNSGFLVRDKVDGATPGQWQLFDSREKSNKPELVLTWS